MRAELERLGAFREEAQAAEKACFAKLTLTPASSTKTQPEPSPSLSRSRVTP